MAKTLLAVACSASPGMAITQPHQGSESIPTWDRKNTRAKVGERCCQQMSSRHGVAIALMSSLQPKTWIPSRTRETPMKPYSSRRDYLQLRLGGRASLSSVLQLQTGYPCWMNNSPPPLRQEPPRFSGLYPERRYKRKKGVSPGRGMAVGEKRWVRAWEEQVLKTNKIL